MDWEGLMRRARAQATLSGQRTKVVASVNNPRMAEYTGSKYTYTILFPEFEWNRRCGALPPTGKPCIKWDSYGHGVYHLSRDIAPNSFTYWIPTDRYGRPSKYEAYSYELHPVSANQVEEMGLL